MGQTTIGKIVEGEEVVIAENSQQASMLALRLAVGHGADSEVLIRVTELTAVDYQQRMVN
jgi:hypothetical protein